MPKELNPGNSNIGIRIPNLKFIIELARYCNEPIALTSANISNEPSSLKITVTFSYSILSLIIDFDFIK